MKIWCQSSAAFGKGALWDAYEKSLKRHVQEVARPGTQVELHGTDFTIAGIDRYRAAAHFSERHAVRNAIIAEEQGFDAYVMISTIDAGSYETREMVDIPVVFCIESGLHLACLLAPKFAFFAHNELLLHRLTGMAQQYGLSQHMVPGGHLNISYNDFPDMFEHPSRHVDKVVRAAREVIARGANILFPAALALTQFMVDAGLQDIDGCRVLDAAGSAVKMAELMVDLKGMGVGRSRSGDYAAPPPEIKEALRQLYKRA